MKDVMIFDRAHCRARQVWFCIAALAAIVAVVAVLLVAQARTPVRAANLLLIYVGADDCAPCRAWQKGDGADFRKSAEFVRIIYHEVKSPHLHDVLNDKYWPEEIRAYRGCLDRSNGVPLWLIVSDNDVVALRFGLVAWQGDVLPTLRSYLH